MHPDLAGTYFFLQASRKRGIGVRCTPISRSCLVGLLVQIAVVVVTEVLLDGVYEC